MGANSDHKVENLAANHGFTVSTTRNADGSITICVGDVCGTVSSDYLTVPKINQLRAAWFRKQSKVGS